MKRSLLESYLSLLLFLSLTNVVFSQWSTDPNNNLIIGIGWDPHIVSDSAGGCYVTYNYESFYPQKLAVERLDKYGYKPWGDKKQILGEQPEQWQAEIIEDGEGGVIISYEDNEVIWPNYNTRLRVQRVDSSGNFLWGETGVRVTTEETNHGLGTIVSDGDGGCVIVWQDYDEHISINRINMLGERVWGDSGVVLASTGTSLEIVSASDGSYYVQINSNLYRIRQNGEMVWQDSVTLGYPVADQEGGVILSGRVWTGMVPKLTAQRKDSLDNNLWQEPYVEIADSLDINSTIDIAYNCGYIYYSWSGKKNGIEKVSQFQALRLDGTKLFPNGSLTIGNPPLGGGAAILPLEQNKTALIYSNSDSPDSLLVQTYDTLGNKLWNKEGILISLSSIGSQSYTTDGNSGFIIAGTIEQFTIVAQQVSNNGKLGEIITSIDNKESEIIPSEVYLYQNFPNPFNSTTIIKYQIPKEGRVQINLYNILGEKILRLYEGEREAGTYTISFSSDELSSGIYFYSLETNSLRKVKKLTILK